MRIIVNKTDFSKALGRIYRIVDRRNTALILGCLLIEARDNKVILKATDLEIEIIEVVEAQCLRTGAATLPAQLLHDLIKRLPNNNSLITIDYDSVKQLVKLSSAHISYDLKALPVSDFPEFAIEKWQHKFKLDSSLMRLMLSRVMQAMSNEDTRYTLHGIELRKVGDELKLAATDAHRLALGSIPAPIGSEQVENAIIPRKAVAELQKMLSEDFEEQLHIQLSETKIEFKFGPVTLASKLIEGHFPDYQNVIPKDNNNRCQVDREEFLALVASVAVVATDYGRPLLFKLSHDNLNLSMESLEADKAEADLLCSYEGEELTLGFNAKYLLDEVAQFVEQDLILLFGSSEDPCIFYDGNDKNLVYVVMPMRY